MPEDKKTRDERINELLEGSASDAVNSIKGPNLADGLSAEEEVKNEDVESENDKKVRIPRSRLKTLTGRLDEFERAQQAYQERIATLERELASSTRKDSEELPEWWVDDYGDTDESKKGYRNYVRGIREEAERLLAEREARAQQYDAERESQIAAIEDSFDDQMDALEDSIGRELTDNQKAELLDIVGEYSPTEDGRYTGFMPVEKAYRIWQQAHTPDRGKEEIARIAGTSSAGGASQASQSSTPPQWGDWRKRFGG